MRVSVVAMSLLTVLLGGCVSFPETPPVSVLPPEKPLPYTVAIGQFAVNLAQDNPAKLESAQVRAALVNALKVAPCFRRVVVLSEQSTSASFNEQIDAARRLGADYLVNGTLSGFDVVFLGHDPHLLVYAVKACRIDGTISVDGYDTNSGALAFSSLCENKTVRRTLRGVSISKSFLPWLASKFKHDALRDLAANASQKIIDELQGVP